MCASEKHIKETLREIGYSLQRQRDDDCITEDTLKDRLSMTVEENKTLKLELSKLKSLHASKPLLSLDTKVWSSIQTPSQQ